MLLRAGAQIRVPRSVAHSRRVAGQLPDGLDLARFGIPADLLATADRMALVNLACTVEAFADAGLTPEELLAEVHPALVGNTQGAGMGGLASTRRLLRDHLLGDERQPDRLQESLGNVVAAHAVQSFVGSYGPMVHPVAACATAAVSLEEAHDKIRAGKALAILAGGFDDLTPEGLQGFGDMGATASSDELEAMGIAPRESSRANDVRRRGFVEAQGGGALLVVRGDVALALGLPVRGVLAYAGSFADGVQASIPASGMGVLAAARGGADSPLARALARLGLSADDIAVVSKHDTSTEMNDTNEADLHERIQAALGRTPGNPLLVVSQKTVTGHAKGGAAAWQVDGMLRMMEVGRRARQPQPRERRPAAARRRVPDARRSPDRARAAGADPRRPRHEPGLRARLGAAGDRPPRHVPRGDPRGRGATSICDAPAGAGPRASSSGCVPSSAARPPCAAATAASAPPNRSPRARRRRRSSPIPPHACAATAPTGPRPPHRDDARRRPRHRHDDDVRRAARRPGLGVRRRDVHRGRAARRPCAGRDPHPAPRGPLRGEGSVPQGLVGRTRRPPPGGGDDRPARDRGRRRRPRPPRVAAAWDGRRVARAPLRGARGRGARCAPISRSATTRRRQPPSSCSVRRSVLIVVAVALVVAAAAPVARAAYPSTASFTASDSPDRWNAAGGGHGVAIARGGSVSFDVATARCRPATPARWRRRR